MSACWAGIVAGEGARRASGRFDDDVTGFEDSGRLWRSSTPASDCRGPPPDWPSAAWTPWRPFAFEDCVLECGSSEWRECDLEEGVDVESCGRCCSRSSGLFEVSRAIATRSSSRNRSDQPSRSNSSNLSRSEHVGRSVGSGSNEAFEKSGMKIGMKFIDGLIQYVLWKMLICYTSIRVFTFWL